MTKKDYELIAKKINYVAFCDKLYNSEAIEVRQPQIKVVCKYLAQELASSLKIDNPRFDKNKFYRACGFNEQF